MPLEAGPPSVPIAAFPFISVIFAELGRGCQGRAAFSRGGSEPLTAPAQFLHDPR